MTEKGKEAVSNNDDKFWDDMGVKDEEKSIGDVEVTPTAPEATVEAPVASVASEAAPIESVRFSPNDLPSLKPTGSIPPEYQETVDRILYSYANLPKLEYDDIYQEIKEELSVKSEPTPDAQSINQLLERIQAAKDRLSEIFVGVIQNYNFKKRAVNILEDTWTRFSTEKSADKRKAEALHITANFEIDLGFTENLYKTCDHVFKTLEGLHDSVSRRITIMQVCLKYADVGRGMLPDFSFQTFSEKLAEGLNTEEIQRNKSNESNESNESNTPFDHSKGIEAEEQDF